jgi:threonine/homoserine/homoserine lactone efflux protein
MPLDVLVPLFGVAFATSVTPGPNNAMLMSSGVNFGFRRTIPHMVGIELGFGLLLLAVGLGLGAVLHAVPGVSLAMKLASVLYLLWLAWKIASSKPDLRGTDSEARPLTLLQAAAFQIVNPKAWTMAFVTMGVYVSDAAPVLTAGIVTLAFMIVGVPSATLWTGCGVALRRFLSDPGRLRVFNIAMGLLLVGSIWPMLQH